MAPSALRRLLVTGTLALSALMAALGCKEEEPVAGPGEVVLELISLLRRAHGDRVTADAAAELLWEPGRSNLEERARRASALSGREISPGEIIVPSWFSPHFAAESTEVRHEGSWAEVELRSSSGERALVRCVNEEGTWKVALELPPLPPIRHRDTESR